MDAKIKQNRDGERRRVWKRRIVWEREGEKGGQSTRRKI